MTFTPASHVRNPDKYYDRTVQEWHAQLDRTWAAIDVDLLGYCPRCYGTIYLIEAAETAEKVTRCVEQAAHSMGAVAILVVHRDHQIVKARTVAPERSQWGNAAELLVLIARLRREHECPPWRSQR
jgi:hypothetical protein